ncbi:MAG: alpha/beta hydrolase [Alphaproteobacteria bacterium]|nr:alpha/beta hydrolase [Alphaproteobacteria bacterium]
MGKIFGLVALFVCAVTAHAEETIVAGTWHSMMSKVMGEERAYAVYLPPSYEDEERRFPVIYVLDGDQTRFKGVSALVENLSTENMEGQIPQFIVVAIPNTDRTRDLTPTHTLAFFKDQTSDELATSGGASRFLQFFEDELIPHMDATYRTTDSRMLVGESYGGLFTANALLSGRNIFSHYLVTDATYIWDNNYLNRALDEQLAEGYAPEGKIYFSFANNAAFGEMGETNLAWGKAFAAKLETAQSDRFHVRHQYFEHESHGTVALQSWYHGFRYFYEGDGKKGEK